MYQQSAGGGGSILHQPMSLNESGALRPPSNPSIGYFHSPSSGQTGTLQKGRPRKRKNNISDVEHFIPALGKWGGVERGLFVWLCGSFQFFPTLGWAQFLSSGVIGTLLPFQSLNAGAQYAHVF